MTKEEILGILKMSEFGQSLMLQEKGVLNIYEREEKEYVESLADAAFRLRDEVCREFGDSYFVQAIMTVCSFAVPSIDKWNMQAKPIHWIVAALLVKIETEHP